MKLLYWLVFVSLDHVNTVHASAEVVHLFMWSDSLCIFCTVHMVWHECYIGEEISFISSFGISLDVVTLCILQEAVEAEE